MNQSDLIIERIYEQTGTTDRPGGQHAGVPKSSIRVTHIPTGIIAQCGHCRSDHMNKKTAMSMVELALIIAEIG